MLTLDENGSWVIKPKLTKQQRRKNRQKLILDSIVKDVHDLNSLDKKSPRRREKLLKRIKRHRKVIQNDFGDL